MAIWEDSHLAPLDLLEADLFSKRTNVAYLFEGHFVEVRPWTLTLPLLKPVAEQSVNDAAANAMLRPWPCRGDWKLQQVL